MRKEKRNKYGRIISGEYEYEIAKPIKDSDLIRAVLENDELNERRDFTSGIFNKSTLHPSQPQQTPKSDPLNF